METSAAGSVDLQRRHAIVTGAAIGIGRAIAARLALRGATVTIVDLDGEQAAATAESIGARSVRLDVSDDEAVSQWAAGIDTVDILVNNAGLWHHTSLLETPTELARRVLDVNLMGTFFCTRELAPKMEAGGAIVNIASVAAERLPAGTGMYGPSKAAVVALTRLAAIELAPRSIRVNAVGPGMVTTERVRPPEMEARRSRNAGRLPIPRPAQMTDVADLVCFLASDSAGYLTGQIVYVDGGYLLVGPLEE